MRYFLAVFLFFGQNALQAQVFMAPPENAANLALGGAGIAFERPLNGVVNPAQLGQSPKLSALAYSTVPFGISGWQAHGVQLAKGIQKNSGFALDVLHNGIEAYQEQRVQLGYGRKLGNALALGANIQGMRASANEYGNRMGIGFAIGVVARPLPKLQMGAVIQNPVGQKIDGQTVGNILRMGAVWQPSETVALTAEVGKDQSRPAQFRGGVEYRPHATVRLRIGTRTQPARIAAGAGFVLKNKIRLDFATEWHPTLGLTPAAMVGYSLW
jgi:hypothetical protein